MRHLPLGKGTAVEKTVSHNYDLRFSFVQIFVHQLIKSFGGHNKLYTVANVAAVGDDVNKRKLVSVFVRFDRLVEMKLPCGFFQGAGVHEYRI